MKKGFVLLASLVFSFSILSQNSIQAQAFQQGTKFADAGLEFANGYGYVSVVPLYGYFESGLTDEIGLGGRLRFWSKYGVTSISMQGVGTYHFNNLLNLANDQLDFFGGFGLGFQRISDEGFGVTGLMLSPHVGGRYFFNEKVGANAKLGYDILVIEGFTFSNASLSLGVSFRF